MAEITVTKIKSLYGELVGYASSLPEPNGYNGSNRIGNRFNSICDELSKLTTNDYSHLKLNKQNTGDHNGWNYDGTTLSSSIAGLVSKLEADYGFKQQIPNEQSAIVINNQNSNSIDIDINFTMENLIENAQSVDERNHLRSINEELKQPQADWEKLKKSLIWILSYSKDLSLKVLPLLLNHYLKVA